MSHIAQQFGHSLLSFARDDEGAQVVEYALIIAVVSIALVVALRALTTGTSFSGFISRVSSCLTSTTCA
ncbi:MULTISPECIES: Flp family type IVb pilin [Comamonas]|uniref:Flp family type IVb pilin n=1 Tax=Comamonas TaxID=283 RepID=UPI0015F7E5C7|nr:MULTISPECIES: Flp family type IVb pilin [Comamonas]UUC95918.1 Flp family type IVb pilin [Comamonas sp. C11]